MVLKRYPNGMAGDYFYMKRTPSPRPEWLRTCAIEHGSGSVIDFPIVDDVAGLLWAINLGCIDLNEWYSRCDDTDRPDYLHFDLDPVEGATFATVRAVALCVRDALVDLGMQPVAKTTGSSGIHVYVAIVRGPLQKEVWTFAKALAQTLERMHPDIVTAEYRIAKRPLGPRARRLQPKRVGQNPRLGLFGACDAARDRLDAGPWSEVEAGIELDDFRLDNVRERFARRWRPVGADACRTRPLRPAAAAGRCDGPAAPAAIGSALMAAPQIAPMELRSVATIPDGPQWLYEPKWDGFRCIAHRDGETVELVLEERSAARAVFSRNRQRFATARGRPLLARRRTGRSDRPARCRSTRCSSGSIRLQAASRCWRARRRRVSAIFDLLRGDGALDVDLPLRERRARLERFARAFAGTTELRLSSGRGRTARR